MENENGIDIMLQNEFQELGFDYKNLIQKPTSYPRDDYKLFDYNFEFDSTVQSFSKCKMQIEFGVEQRPGTDDSFQIHNMLCKAFPVGVNFKSDEDLHALYYHRDKGLPPINEVVNKMQRSLRYLEVRQKFNIKSNTDHSTENIQKSINKRNGP